MAWIGAAIMGGAAIYGSTQSKKASDKLGETSQAALANDRYMYNQSRQDMAPYRDVGYSALNAYARAMGLPGSNASPSSGQNYGSGNEWLTPDGVRQAYRDILGRDPTNQELAQYLNYGPRVKESAFFSDPNAMLYQGYQDSMGGKGLEGLVDPRVYGSNGPASAGRGTIDFLSDPLKLRDSYDPIGAKIFSGAFGKGSKNDTMPTPITFNNLRTALTNSDEYKQGVESGKIQPYGQQSAPVMDGDRYGGFYASPGYQFRMDEGVNALDRSAAARGRLLSGAQAKALNRYGQGVASDEFSNYTNRLAQLAGYGGQVVNQGAALSQSAANSQSNILADIGNARASGYLGSANAFSNLGGILADAYSRSRQANNVSNANAALDQYFNRPGNF